MARDGRHYTASQYFPGEIFGSIVKGVRNENLEKQTFNDELFDIVISLDVMEHVYYPDRVFAEVYRTLKPGGVYICTFPMRNYQVTGWERRFIKKDDGTVEHMKEPEIHGNPVSSEGSIVTVDYGYDLHKTIATWAPFDIRVSRFNDEFHGIIGEYTEVIVCQKRGPRTLAAKVAPVRMGFSRLCRALIGKFEKK